MTAIEVKNIVKQYKNGVRALDGLSLTAGSGEIFSLLGPNGAGKSSLINILTTFYRPTSGSITMLGRDLSREAAWIRSQIACVAQNVSIDAHLSLMENMIFQSRLYKVEKQTAKRTIDSLIDSFGLADYLKYPVASYSGGIKRRLDIAMNMASLPKILFLDEPTTGMDAMSRKAMWEMLLKIREEYKTTIFLTTHYLEEAEQLSDTICIMKDGKEIAQGTTESLRQYIKQNMLRVGLFDAVSAEKYRETLENAGFAKFIDIRGSSIVLGVEDSRAAFKLVNRYLLDHHAEFSSIEIAEPSLEDVFLALTCHDKNRLEGYVC